MNIVMPKLLQTTAENTWKKKKEDYKVVVEISGNFFPVF